MEKVYLKEVIDALQRLYEKYGDLPVSTTRIDIITSNIEYSSNFKVFAMTTEDHKQDHAMILIE